MCAIKKEHVSIYSSLLNISEIFCFYFLSMPPTHLHWHPEPVLHPFFCCSLLPALFFQCNTPKHAHSQNIFLTRQTMLHPFEWDFSSHCLPLSLRLMFGWLLLPQRGPFLSVGLASPFVCIKSCLTHFMFPTSWRSLMNSLRYFLATDFPACTHCAFICTWSNEILGNSFDKVGCWHENGDGADDVKDTEGHKAEAIDDSPCKLPLLCYTVAFILGSETFSNVTHLIQYSL